MPTELRAIQEQNFGRGIETVFVLDDIEFRVRVDGKEMKGKARGFAENGRVYVKVNNTYTAEQINGHETFHVEAGRYPEAVTGLMDEASRNIPPDVMAIVIQEYQRAYQDVYDNTKIIELAREEIFADIAGGMNPLANIPEVKAAVGRFYDEIYGRGAGEEFLHGIEESTRYSVKGNTGNGVFLTEKRGEWNKGETEARFDTSDSGDIMIQQEIRKRILSGEFPKMLRIGHQKKHQKGTHEYKQYVEMFKEKGEYGPSRITISNEEIERLIREYAGKGRIRIKNGKWLNYEIVTANDKIIGTVINNLTGEEIPTTVFKIHYSKNGIHIVPDYPSKRGDK